MKIFPSKIQWNKWTLPSKVTYLGFILAIAFFIASTLINFYLDSYKKKSDKPKITIEPANKPFLRFEKKSATEIEFSYELCFKNMGHNTATNLKHSNLVQRLYNKGKILIEVKSDLLPNKKSSLPFKIVSGDKFYKIYMLRGKNLSAKQMVSLIKKYNDETLSIIFDINLEYEDEITGKQYNSQEILSIHKNKVLIVN